MRVALLGTGLIGGSIGLALRRVPEVEYITAFDLDPKAAARAVDRGAADSIAHSPAEAVAGASIVFVAAPVGAIPRVIAEASSGLERGAVVTDVGSTKSRLVLEADRATPEGVTFIGGHPMAGTEEEGIEAAKATLFEGCWWILTPTKRVDASAYERLHDLVTGIGAQVMALDPERHDDLLAVISHLPHLTAAALMNLASERGRDNASLLSLAAGGFRDVTRVAASNPDIWLDICAENATAISAVLGEFSSRLADLAAVVQAGDREELRKRLLKAREARRNLPGKPAEGELVELLVPVPDRPGVLAEVTTAIGSLGVNIEDLQITHAEEGGRGTLRLLIIGLDGAHRAQAELTTRGYEPRLISL